MIGDLQLETNRPDAALDAYEASLKEAPNCYSGSGYSNGSANGGLADIKYA